MILPLLANTRSGLAKTNFGARPASDVLVAYFSRSGNTRVTAGQIHRALGSALFEIEPATPYPEDYEETVDEQYKE